MGNATLYRNFPTRDLLAAVIEDTVCELLADSAGPSAICPPRRRCASDSLDSRGGLRW
ncbi:hypothetical protein [Mycobacterium sp. GA-2829]|uniref:hypothetical protein n=1 Tax=Mycobacterium sp. GA-2829 TaxID=1772283 RepID=UPI000B190DB2|nr:hypothetical protein [Mycobacterium sp. GA-2829]